MKKLTAFLLCLALLLSLAACAAGQKADRSDRPASEETKTPQPEQTAPAEAPRATGEFSIGFGRAIVTPEVSVPLAGYGNDKHRYSTNVLDDLCATCIAFQDADGNTILMFTVDLLYASDTLTGAVRSNASKLTGVPKTNIMVCGTHTHSGVSTAVTSDENVISFITEFGKRAGQAAADAIADLAPAQMFSAELETSGLNFVRRYALNDGEWLSDNYNDSRNADIVAHESEADHTMRIVKAVREGKPDILVCNWQAHATKTGGMNKTDISPDFIGVFRNQVEQETGCLCAYFTGGAGNINTTSRIKADNSISDCTEYGRKLAQFLLEMPDSAYTELRTGRVGALQSKFKADVDHSMDAKIVAAATIVAEWNMNGDRNAANAKAKEAGFHSVYHCSSIKNKKDLGPTLTLELNGLCAGELAFTTAPFEMFDVTANEIRDGSDYGMTFVCSCANGYQSYIPSAEAMTHAGYENDMTKFEPGTAEQIRDELLSLLAGLRE